MRVTPFKRQRSNSPGEIVDTPLSKKARVTTSSPNSVLSDSSPNSARPKRDHKPSKRFGAPEPLTPQSRPRPRPLAKEGILRTSLPNTPTPAKQATPQTSAQSRLASSLHPSIEPPTPNTGTSQSSHPTAQTPSGNQATSLSISRPPSPQKSSQTSLKLHLPSRAGLGLQSQLPGTTRDASSPSPAVEASKSTNGSRSPQKRKAKAAPLSKAEGETRKKPKKAEPMAVLDLQDSEEEANHPITPKSSSKKPVPGLRPISAHSKGRKGSPDVIDLCSDGEEEPEHVAKPLKIALPSKKALQRRATYTCSAVEVSPPKMTPLNRTKTHNIFTRRPSTPVEFEDGTEAQDLTRSLSPPVVADPDQSIEIVRLQLPDSDMKEPTIYGTSPFRTASSDDNDFSFYASSPHPQIHAEEKDPTDEGAMSSSPLKANNSGDFGARQQPHDGAPDVAEISPDFYVPSPAPIQADVALDSPVDLVIENDILPPAVSPKLPLFLPAGTDSSQEDSDPLPTLDSQMTIATDSQDDGSPVEIIRHIVLPPIGEAEPPRNRTTSPAPMSDSPYESDSDSEEPLAMDDAQMGGQSHLSNEEYREHSSVSLGEDPGEYGREDRGTLPIEGRAQTPDSVTDETMNTIADILGLTEHDPPVPQHSEIEEELISLSTAPAEVSLSQVDCSMSSTETIVHQAEVVSTRNANSRKLERINTGVTHTEWHGPGTPSVYNPSSMPPLLTPKFFAQSYLPSRLTITPTYHPPSPSMPELETVPFAEPMVEEVPVEPNYSAEGLPQGLGATLQAVDQARPSSPPEILPSSEPDLPQDEEARLPTMLSSSSREEGEISDYPMSQNSSSPPRIDLSKISAKTPRSRTYGISRKLSGRARKRDNDDETKDDNAVASLDKQFGDQIDQAREGELARRSLQKSRYALDPFNPNGRPQASMTSWLDEDLAGERIEPLAPRRFVNLPAKPSQAVLSYWDDEPDIEAPISLPYGDPEEPQATPNTHADSPTPQEQELALVVGQCTPEPQSPMVQEGAQDTRPPKPMMDGQVVIEESTAGTPHPESIQGTADQDRVLGPPSTFSDESLPQVANDFKNSTVNSERSSVHQAISEQAKPAFSADAFVLTEEMIAEQPSYTEFFEEADELFSLIANFAGNSIETAPAILPIDPNEHITRTRTHSESSSSSDSTALVTPSAVDSNLFFLNQEDVRSFKNMHRSLGSQSIPMLDHISDKMSDIDDDDFLATHDLVYPD